MAGLPWIAAMAFFMQALDATILNTALPAIAQSLNRSPLAMQSAIISYTLTVAMLIPVSGWLADRFGTRRVFMLAVTLFTLGSLACALHFINGAGYLSRTAGHRRRDDDAGGAPRCCVPTQRIAPRTQLCHHAGAGRPNTWPGPRGVLVTRQAGTGFS